MKKNLIDVYLDKEVRIILKDNKFRFGYIIKDTEKYLILHSPKRGDKSICIFYDLIKSIDLAEPRGDM